MTEYMIMEKLRDGQNGISFCRGNPHAFHLLQGLTILDWNEDKRDSTSQFKNPGSVGFY